MFLFLFSPALIVAAFALILWLDDAAKGMRRTAKD